MKAFHLTVAMWLLTGSQYASAIPTTELLDVLQSNGLENLNARDLSSLLQSLASGSCNNALAPAGAGRAPSANDSAASEGSQSSGNSDAGAGSTTGDGNGAQVGQGGQGEQAAEGGEGGEGEGNEVDLPGTFGTAVAVEGGDIKQDILFTKSTVGSFEYEFTNKIADSVTVVENKTPAPPPTGFEALETSSYQVSLATSKGVGLTLSKIDFIFDPTSAGLQGKDITKAQVGKLCVDTGAFTISESLGELEFELDENEVTLNLNKNVTAEGEWGIFIPISGQAAGNGTAVGGKTATGENTTAENDQSTSGKTPASGETAAGKKKEKAASSVSEHA